MIPTSLPELHEPSRTSGKGKTKLYRALNFIGKNDKIGLKFDNNFFTHDFNNTIKNNDKLTLTILNFMKKHKVNFNNNFSILVNNGPGSFSSIRVSLAIAKGIKISKKINLFGFSNLDLGRFSLENIELLIKKNLIQKKLIKPIYLS